MKWTEDSIALAVATDIFDWRRYVVVPNVDWGLLPHEADLCALSDSDWLSEIEIKISVADFRRDAAKAKNNRQPCELVGAFYYAMPGPVYHEVQYSIPEDIGVILVGQHRSGRASMERKAARKPGARKLTTGERMTLMRLGYLRYWARCRATTFMVTAMIARAEDVELSAIAKSMTPAHEGEPT